MCSIETRICSQTTRSVLCCHVTHATGAPATLALPPVSSSCHEGTCGVNVTESVRIARDKTMRKFLDKGLANLGGKVALFPRGENVSISTCMCAAHELSSHCREMICADELQHVNTHVLVMCAAAPLGS